MDPFSLLLGALILTGFARVGIAITADAYATVKAAQAGAWDVIDRQRERRASFWQRAGAAWANRRRARHQAAGGSGEFRPGARAYAADVYHGFWEDQLERRAARRAARGPYTFDPDRLSWADRFDAAVMRKVNTLRERWGQRTPEPVADTPLDELLDHGEPEPVIYDPGTWTVDEQGRRIALASDAADDDSAADSNHDDEHQGVVDAIHGTAAEEETATTTPEGDTMSTPTGEAIDVTTAVTQCKNMNLEVVAIQERVNAEATALVAQLEQMAKAAETLDTSARAQEFDPATLDRAAAMFEAIDAMRAAIGTFRQQVAANCEAVSAAVVTTQQEFEKHLPGVEFNAAVGGMAHKSAYQSA